MQDDGTNSVESLSQWLDKLTTASQLLYDARVVDKPAVPDPDMVAAAHAALDAVGREMAEHLGVPHNFGTPSTHRPTKRGFSVPLTDSEF